MCGGSAVYGPVGSDGPVLASVDRVDEVFAHSCREVRAALPYLRRDRCWPVYDRDLLSCWVDRRLVLTGDAAHPMLQYFAQGACQALEDASCLAGQFTVHPDDWDRALRAYADARIGRTAQIQRKVRAWGELLHADGLLRDVRNTLFHDRDSADYRHVDWLHDHTEMSDLPLPPPLST